MLANKWCYLAISLLTVLTTQLKGCGGEIRNGEQAFKRCLSCHSIVPGKHFTGPSLANLWNRKAGSETGFLSYSTALRTSGVIWTAASLDAWIKNPQEFIPGTKMEFEGIADQKVRKELILILKQRTSSSPNR